MDTKMHSFTRRDFLRRLSQLGLLAALHDVVPAYAWQSGAVSVAQRTGRETDIIDLLIRKETIRFGGREGMATTINGSVPGPLLRFREGETITIRVTNQLDEDTSIHWHGLLVPAGMDGVPGVSFPGIRFILVHRQASRSISMCRLPGVPAGARGGYPTFFIDEVFVKINGK